LSLGTMRALNKRLNHSAARRPTTTPIGTAGGPGSVRISLKP
jgi:hypothetical protein